MASPESRPATPEEIASLQQGGFSEQQIEQLKKLRNAYPFREFTDNNKQLNRLAILKWEHDNQQSKDDTVTKSKSPLTVNNLIKKTTPSLSTEPISLAEGTLQNVEQEDTPPKLIPPTEFSEIMQGWAESRADFEAMMLKDKGHPTASFTEKESGLCGKFYHQDFHTQDNVTYGISLIKGGLGDGTVKLERRRPTDIEFVTNIDELTISLSGEIHFNQYKITESDPTQKPISNFIIDTNATDPVNLSDYQTATIMFNETNEIYSQFIKTNQPKQ